MTSNQLQQFREFVLSTIAATREQVLKQLQATETQLLEKLDEIILTTAPSVPSEPSNLTERSSPREAGSKRKELQASGSAKAQSSTRKKKAGKSETVSLPKKPQRSKSPQPPETKSQPVLLALQVTQDDTILTQPLSPRVKVDPRASQDLLRPRTGAFGNPHQLKSYDLQTPARFHSPPKSIIVSLDDDSKNKKRTDSNKAHRVVGAAVYKHLVELQGRHTPAPAKFKGSFSGLALTSFMLDKFGLKRREDAFALSRYIFSYLSCCSEPGASFKDSETWYYEFQFPVFMFHEKIIEGLKPAIDSLLGHSDSDPHLETPPGGVAIKTPVFKLAVEVRWTGKMHKKWKARFAVLYADELKLFKSDEARDPLLVIKHSSITRACICEAEISSLAESAQHSKHWLLTFVDDERLSSLRVRSLDQPEVLTQMMLGINGLKYQMKPLLSLENACVIDSDVLSCSLSGLYLSGHKGGEVSSGDEQWQYTSEGLANNLNENYQYHWDGEFFQPGSSDFNYGTGKWDGLNLWWFPPMGNSFFSLRNRVGDSYFGKTPLYHYIYNSVDREFSCGVAEKDWKFSRHFLVSKSSASLEWKIEGDLPNPVVMCLELIRAARADSLKKRKSSKAEENLPEPSPQPTPEEELAKAVATIPLRTKTTLEVSKESPERSSNRTVSISVLLNAMDLSS